MDNTNYMQDTAERLMAAMNDQIAKVIVEEINQLINLDSIIDNDKAGRKKDFEERLASTTDADLIEAMWEYKEFTFSSISEKLEYAFAALLHKWFTFTHDVLPTGKVIVRFYEIKSTKEFQLETTYNVSII